MRYAPEGRVRMRAGESGRAEEFGSYEAGDGTVVTTWQPRPEHEAFEGFVKTGGILGTLIDCHSNWTAIAALLARNSSNQAPSDGHLRVSVKFGDRPHPTSRSE